MIHSDRTHDGRSIGAYGEMDAAAVGRLFWLYPRLSQ